MAKTKSRDGPTTINDKGSSKNSSKRLTIKLSGADLQNLEWLAQEQGISFTEAIKKSLNTDAFVKKTLKKGFDILIKENSEEIYKLLLH